jgi:hypothetical protein
MTTPIKKPDWLDKVDLGGLRLKLERLRDTLPRSWCPSERPQVDPAKLDAKDYLDQDDYKKLIKVLGWLESPSRGRGRFQKGFKLKQQPLLPGLFLTDKQKFNALTASGMTEKEACKELEKQWSVTERSVKRRINKAT